MSTPYFHDMVHCNALKGLAKDTINWLPKLVAMERFAFHDKIKMKLKLKNVMNIFLALTIEQV